MTDNCQKIIACRQDDIVVKNFGCRLNNYEGSLIKSQLTKIADESGQQLNCVVINSCAVTSDAEKQVRQAIRRTAKDYPNHKIIVTGCASHINPDEYKSMECVDAVVGNDVKTAAASYDFLKQEKKSAYACAAARAFSFFFSLGYTCIEGLKGLNLRKNKKDRLSRHGEATLQELKYHAMPMGFRRNAKAFLFFWERGLTPICAAARAFFCPADSFSLSRAHKTSTENFKEDIPAPTDRVRGYLEIQNGCDHRCTFCVIPFGRGDSRSLSATEILRQIDSLSRQGIKEVTLSGVDITSYDAGGGGGLGNLLKRICTNFPQMKLRLSSLDGIELDEDFLQVFADYKQIHPHLHLSLQSGNDLILKRMKRRHNRADAINLMHRLRNARSDVVFGADFICGFPTEDEAMFADTCSLVEKSRITWLHVFPYSPRPNTAAARIPNQVPMAVRKMRVRQLRALGDKMANDYMASMIGTCQDVLLEHGGSGYTNTYAPVRFKGVGVVGDIHPMRMIDVEKNTLVGELI